MTSKIKKIYYRLINNGKQISFGEYISGKWHNVTEPFALNDTKAWKQFRRALTDWERRTKRTWKFIPYTIINTPEPQTLLTLLNQ